MLRRSWRQPFHLRDKFGEWPAAIIEGARRREDDMKPNNAEETWVRRFERELMDLAALFRRNRFTALLLVCAALAYASLTYGPDFRGTSPEAAAATPTPIQDTITLPNPARIRNPLEISVRVAIGDGGFETIQAGGELPVMAPKAGTVVRLHSCGWGAPPCKERQYPIFAGQHWRVTLEEPYPRIGLALGE